MRCQNATATDARKKLQFTKTVGDFYECRHVTFLSRLQRPTVHLMEMRLAFDVTLLSRMGIICGLVHLREVGEEFGKAKRYQLANQNAKERAQFKFCGSIDQNTVLHGQEQLFNR